MQRSLRLVVVVAILAVAGSAFAGFGVPKVPKMPVKGDPGDVTAFVKAADYSYADVRTISVDMPGQVIDVSDDIMGLKDFPADPPARDRYAALKADLVAATDAVKTTDITDMKSLKSANARVDDATDALVALMRDLSSTEGAMKIIGGADLPRLQKKTQRYLEQDTKAVETVTGKLGESGKTAPAATKSWTLGIPDSYTVEVSGGKVMNKKQVEGLVKDGPSHVDTWQKIVQRRFSTFKDFAGKLGLTGK